MENYFYVIMQFLATRILHHGCLQFEAFEPGKGGEFDGVFGDGGHVTPHVCG
jgi:hypothetical protein